MKIGIITNDQNQVFQQEVIAGICACVEPAGYTITIAETGHENAQLEAVKLDWRSMAGLLVIANVLHDDAVHTLFDADIPVTLVSHQVENLPIPTVVPDNRTGMRQLVDYLVLTRQRQRIVFIQGDLNQNDGKERTQAFRYGLMRHDISIDADLFVKGDFIVGRAEQAMEAVLQQGISFDAVAAADYLMAEAALNVLKAAGKRIPEDVCVVGFGDAPTAAEIGLTTVGVDVEQIGRRAARQLMGQIQNLTIRGATLLATRIIERATG